MVMYVLPPSHIIRRLKYYTRPCKYVSFEFWSL